MNTITFKPSRIIRVEETPVARHFDVSDGARIFQTVFFTAKITWVIDEDIKLRVLDANGRVVKEGPTHNDFYGSLTHIGEIMTDHVPSVERSYGIDRTSALEAQVETTFHLVPYLDDRVITVWREPEMSYKPLPKGWWRDRPELRRDLEAPLDGWERWEAIKKTHGISRETKKSIVYTSREGLNPDRFKELARVFSSMVPLDRMDTKTKERLAALNEGRMP